jgi:hypothetical protein
MGWDLDFEEGGGGLDGATGKVTDSYFQDGEYGWSWVVKTTFDDPENYPKFEDGAFTRYFGLGKDWTSTDGGETAVHTSGDPSKRYNKNSQAAQFALRLASIDGAQDAIPDFSPYVAASIKGAHLVWKNVPVNKRAPKVDENGVRVQENGKDVWVDVPGATQLFPVALAGAGTPSSNGAATVDVDALGLNTEQINLLSVAAQTCDTDGKFIEALAKHPEVMGNSTFMGAVSKNTKGVREALAAATF